MGLKIGNIGELMSPNAHRVLEDRYNLEHLDWSMIPTVTELRSSRRILDSTWFKIRQSSSDNLLAAQVFH